MKTMLIAMMVMVGCAAEPGNLPADAGVGTDADRLVDAHLQDATPSMDAARYTVNDGGYVYDAGCPVLLPCSHLGCDGTQTIPLYCPEDDNSDACFCSSNTVDGWCTP